MPVQKSKIVQNLDAGSPQHMVTYGTSLTGDGAWVEQLRTCLSARYPGLATVTNSGMGGTWSQWGVENLRERVIRKRPDAVIVEFAINDAVLRFGCSPELSRANLQSMIARVLVAETECELILMTTNPTTDGSPRPRLSEYYQVYRDTAHECELLLIDVEPVWKHLLTEDREIFNRYVPDGVHPSAAGCEKVVTPIVLAALGLNVG